MNLAALITDGTMGAPGAHNSLVGQGGMSMYAEPALTTRHILFGWPTSPFGLAVAVALVAAAVWYLRASVAVERRGRRWHRRRTASFLAGLFAVELALGSPVAVYANFTFTAHVLQHLLLMIAAPPLLALGAPMTLILQTVRRPTKVRLLRGLHSRPFGILSHPLPVFFLYYLSMYAFFLTGALGYSMDHMWLMDLINLGFLGGATLFWWPMVGLDPILQWKMSPGFKLLNLMIGIPVESFLGIALLMSVKSVAPMYTVTSTHTGGGVLWTATELATLLALGPVFVQWSRSDAREGQRTDARLRCRRGGHRPGHGGPRPGRQLPVDEAMSMAPRWALTGVAPRRASATGARGRLLATMTPRRALQLALGVVWLLDAALQYQPYMFTRAFVTQVIEPTAAGDPSVVARSVTWSAHLMVQHIAVYNAVFATVQLVIAVALFSRRTVRAALAASIVWALLVWWFGEGLGGIFTAASPLAGVPGGVVLYVVIAVVLWPPRTPGGTEAPELGSPATTGLAGAGVARTLWVVLWGSFCWYFLLAVNRAPSAVSGIFAASGPGEAGWIRSLEHTLADWSGGDGTEISIVLAVISGVVALAVLAPPLVRPAVVVAGALGALIWVAEAFGGIFTGQGTDPNSGLLLILLAACFWPFAVSPGAAPAARPAPDARRPPPPG